MSLAQGQIPPKDEDQQQKLANALNKNKDAIVSDEEKEEIETELKKEIPDSDKAGATKKVTPSKVETFQASIGMSKEEQTGKWEEPTNVAWKKWLDDNQDKLIQLAKLKGVITENLNHYIYESLNSRSLRLIIEMSEADYIKAIEAAKTDATKLLALFKDGNDEQIFGTKLTGLQNLVNATDKVSVTTTQKTGETDAGQPEVSNEQKLIPLTGTIKSKVDKKEDINWTFDPGNKRVRLYYTSKRKFHDDRMRPANTPTNNYYMKVALISAMQKFLRSEALEGAYHENLLQSRKLQSSYTKTPLKVFRAGIADSTQRKPFTTKPDWNEYDKNAQALYDTYEALPDVNISIPRGLNL